MLPAAGSGVEGAGLLVLVHGQRPGAVAVAGGAKKLDLLSDGVYARVMDAWAQPLAFSILILACILMGLFGAESRPGFSDGRTGQKERWFIHSKND